VSDPIQPWPIVRRGDQGHPVITLQELLRAHGLHIAADGVFGPATEAAVKAVQTSRGVPADGVAGPQTWPLMIVTVRRGSQGDAVRGVQVEIEFRNLSGEPGLPIDGIFGPLTEQSVRGFQQALSIAVDGIVGPVTWRAYVSGMLSL
jgi:peptidoglycan hydrolase-like protein with peptidoglycan-binding domain